MATPLFFNHHSLPCATRDKVPELFKNMMSGVSRLLTSKVTGNSWYADAHLSAYLLADDGYTYSNLKQEHQNKSLRSEILQLEQLKQRCPTLDVIERSVANALRDGEVRLSGQVEPCEYFILGAAHLSGGVAISFGVCPPWQDHTIKVDITLLDPDSGDLRFSAADVMNVSDGESASAIVANLRVSIEKMVARNWTAVLPEVEATPEFLEWLSSEPEDLQSIVMHDIQTCHKMNYNNVGAGKIKILDGTSKHNVAEIRIQYRGDNNVRPLFQRTPDRRVIFLWGGRKTDDHWYGPNVAKADRLYENWLQKNKVT